MEITATISSVLPMVSGVSAKGEWKKATVVVKFMDGQYEQFLALDNMRNADAFAALQVGQTMKFYYSVSSREHNGKWFTAATCWKWEPATAQQPTPTPIPTAPTMPTPQPSGYNMPSPAGSNLPF